MTLAKVSLEDKYTLQEGRIFLTGIQALVRLPMMQRQRDLAAGLNTAGFISGYRGSPLAGYDQALWRAERLLKEHHIRFVPGVNEDLAATAVWGTQQVNLSPHAKYDGVFALWYGKGPGVDRSGDVFRHANAFGTSKHGGVLVVAGDDHGAVSSTLPHQTEHCFMSWMMPVLHPANVQEYLDYGLLGWAMSRFSGCYVGFTALSETVESAASIHVDPHRLKIIHPDIDLPEGGVHYRLPDERMEQEHRLHHYKVYAALEFARANNIDRIIIDSPRPRIGIITTGKSYLDVRQALEDLGIDDATARRIGLRLYKVGMTWPLEPHGARAFAEGLEEVLVVEEKRALIENQLKEQLYNWREDVRPRVIGKFDEERNWLLPAEGELTPARIARVIAARIGRFHTSEEMQDRLAFLERKEKSLSNRPAPVQRVPYFCSGCPHNTSTKVPEGSRALVGIGCHYMVQWMNRRSQSFSQMGGEGVSWVGEAPFTEEQHVFANLGDGTYYHSGILAIRAAVAAGVNITYKILYNDAVAMTGGQPVEGSLTVAEIASQLHHERVVKIVIVTDEPEKYPLDAGFPPGTRVFHRHRLMEVQKELAATPGVTALIYDQTCAAEKRRRRKRGLMEDPPKRVFINDLVCEGCGDCSEQSNCISVEPLETEWGRKRVINQSSCNKDYTCLDGFCPSFVTVHGGRLRRFDSAEMDPDGPRIRTLPEPELPDISEPYGILVTGVGGTGVITIGALLGMAAHMEGKGVSVLDQTGLAQKGGAVMSHVRIAPRPEDLNAVRLPAGGANLLLGCDMVVSGSFDALAKVRRGHTQAVINSHKIPTADFVLNPDADFHADDIVSAICAATGEDAVRFIEATELATALMGDAIATNLFMMGFAWQSGLIPLGREAIEEAIRLNGVAVDMNRRAFAWGRLARADFDTVKRAAAPVLPSAEQGAGNDDLETMIARRADFLTGYQNRAYARSYEDFVRKVAAVEQEKTPGRDALARAVAQNLFRLMAYKDEYEVARLYTEGTFLRRLNRQFEGDFTLQFHLAPPTLTGSETGRVEKRSYGPWMMSVFRLLSRLKWLRGTPFDPFGRSEERRRERELISTYRRIVEECLPALDERNHPLAVEIAEVPRRIRGYGFIKTRAMDNAHEKWSHLRSLYATSTKAPQAAE